LSGTLTRVTDRAREIRDYWFGREPPDAANLSQRMRMWFGTGGGDPVQQARDEELRTRFGDLVAQAARGELAAWADSPRRRLSLILLLDQLPRNIYRGTARAFATDREALELTLTGIQSGADAALDAVARIFFYMPLQHAEVAEVQEESVAAFRRLAGEAPEALREIFGRVLQHAEEHRAVIEQFGRFPARNAALGRQSTPEERVFLEALGAQ